jgi:hypothetical protein
LLHSIITQDGTTKTLQNLRESAIPLLGSYIFLTSTSDSDDVGRTRILLRERVTNVHLVSAGHDRGWLTIPYSDVNDLMRREDAGEFWVERTDTIKSQEFRVGDWVIVVGTGLDGKRGVVLKRFNATSYQVGVGNLSVTAKAEQLERADPSAAGGEVFVPEYK